MDERPILDQIKSHVAATVAGGDPIELQKALLQLYGNLSHAIHLCTMQGAQNPSRGDFFQRNIVAYNAAIDEVEAMDDAVEAEDWPAVQAALQRLEHAAQETHQVAAAGG